MKALTRASKILFFLAGISVLTLFWFSRELFYSRIFCFIDLTYYFYPCRSFMVESIKHFSIPLWNPYNYFGFPFFATLQHGLLYPLSIIYFIFPFDLAFDLFLIIHYPLAAIFMYLYLSEKGRSFWASVIGGLTFAFSGYLLSVLHMPTSLASVIWLPLILFFWDRMLIKSEIRKPACRQAGPKSEQCWDLIILIILLAIMFLGGEPGIFYTTILFLAFYAAFYKGFLKNIFALGAVTLVSLALVAVQLFPFLELSLNSVRAGGLSFYEATRWSMSPQRLIEFIVPFFYHLTTLPWASTQWLKSLYLGIFPLVLATAAIFMPDKRMKRFLFSGLAISLILAIGKYTPVYSLLYNIFPGFSLIRYPAKIIFISTFIIAALSAYGFDALREYKGKLNLFYSLIIIAGAVLLAFSAAGYLAPDWFYKISRPLLTEEIRAGFEPQMRLMSMRNIFNLGISGIFMVIAGIILYCAGKKEKLLILLLPFFLFDIYLVNYDLNFSMSSNDFQVFSPNINLLMKDREQFRVLASPELLKREEYETSDESLDYKSALISIRDRVAADQNMLYKIESAQIYESIHGADQETILNNLYALNDTRGLPLLDLLNIKYLLTPQPFINPAFRLLSKRDELIKTGSIFLYQNQNVLPRQFEVSSYEVFADRKKLLDYMFSGGFNPKTKLLLEEEPGKCDRFLFISESFYPGWKVFVDGKEAKIYRANYMFRAVPLSPGRHDIKFVYDPASFKSGALISLITILGLIGFALYPVMRENKKS